MPRFDFDVHDGAASIDDEGAELPSLREARRQAAAMSGRLLSDDPDRFWTRDEWRISVHDGAGLVLFELIFMAVPSPAMGRRQSGLRTA